MKQSLFFQILLVLAFLIVFSSDASSLAVSAKQHRFYIDFEPGYSREDEFIITNREGFTSTYNIRPEVQYGADLSPYFTITPKRIENIPDGGQAAFKVKLDLPESIEIPGESYTIISIDIDPGQSGFRAYPAIGLSYRVFVLYPFKHMDWTFYAPDINENETGELKATIRNIGKPVIENAYASIDIVSQESGEIVKTLKTSQERVEPKDKKALVAYFDSTGYKPGNYLAVPVLTWDSNVSVVNDSFFKAGESRTGFRIGTKEVKILNFTDLFEYNSINQMDILIESAWNTEIKNLFADITIYDIETKEKLREFKSISTALQPWEKIPIYAYFDTKNLEKKEYLAKIILNYEGSKTESEGRIRIDENINAITFEEMPGKFKLNLSGIFTTLNLMILLLIIFILVNVYLAVSVLKNKKEEERIDPAVLEHVKELKKKYSDSYIKGMMLQKGWSEKKVERILKEAAK